MYGGGAQARRNGGSRRWPPLTCLRASSAILPLRHTCPSPPPPTTTTTITTYQKKPSAPAVYYYYYDHYYYCCYHSCYGIIILTRIPQHYHFFGLLRGEEEAFGLSLPSQLAVGRHCTLPSSVVHSLLNHHHHHRTLA